MGIYRFGIHAEPEFDKIQELMKTKGVICAVMLGGIRIRDLH